MNIKNNILKKGDLRFIFYFFSIFLGTFFVLYVLGLLPSELSKDKNSAVDNLRLNALEMVEGTHNPSTLDNSARTVKEEGEEPVRLVIPEVNIDTLILNPQTKDNALLNEYLTRGAIRYVDSSLLGVGHVLIFGHSSNWKVVQNNAYKALNGIENLKAGDLIYLFSNNNRYTYSVTKVSLVNAEEEFIDFSSGKNMLTLSTCNTFGQKQERYVAEADFVSKETR